MRSQNKTVFLRLERPIIDGFRLRHLTIAPGANLLWAGKADTNCVKIVDFEHWWSGERFIQHQSLYVARAHLLSECLQQALSTG